VSDQLWPPLRTGTPPPVSIGHCMIDVQLPAQNEPISAFDIVTAMECLCADLSIDIGTFEVVLLECATLCWHVKGEGLLGLSDTLCLALPAAKLDCLAIVPMLIKPAAHSVSSSMLRRRGIDTVILKAIATADVVRRSWVAVRDRTYILPRAEQPQLDAIWAATVSTENGMRSLWQGITGTAHDLGHHGKFGGFLTSAVPRLPEHPPAEGLLVGCMQTVVNVPALSGLGTIRQPPPPLNNVLVQHTAAHEGHVMLAALLAAAGAQGVRPNDVVGTVYHHRYDASTVVRPCTPTEHGVYAATYGENTAALTVASASRSYVEATGPNFPLRSPAVKWYFEWGRASAAAAPGLAIGAPAGPRPPQAMPPCGPPPGVPRAEPAQHTARTLPR
jgi:hypothetical protein